MALFTKGAEPLKGGEERKGGEKEEEGGKKEEMNEKWGEGGGGTSRKCVFPLRSEYAKRRP